MSDTKHEPDYQPLKRKIRLLSILDSGEAAGITPLPVLSVHMIAYFADVLAPVWDLPVLDAVVLKRVKRPFFPRLQADLDSLVGRGIVEVTRFEYLRTDGGEWRIDADYVLNRRFSDPILAEARRHSQQAEGLEFVREVVYAVSGFGTSGIEDLGLADAAYSDPFVDVGGVIDVAESRGESNASVKIALRFRELVQDTSTLSDAEMVHLYVRHLYSRMQVA